jgi:hypothetical protein
VENLASCQLFRLVWGKMLFSDLVYLPGRTTTVKKLGFPS